MFAEAPGTTGHKSEGFGGATRKHSAGVYTIRLVTYGYDQFTIRRWRSCVVVMLLGQGNSGSPTPTRTTASTSCVRCRAEQRGQHAAGVLWDHRKPTQTRCRISVNSLSTVVKDVLIVEVLVPATLKNPYTRIYGFEFEAILQDDSARKRDSGASGMYSNRNVVAV